MAAPTTVNQANESLRVSMRTAEGGVATMLKEGNTKGAMCVEEIVINLPVPERTVAILTGSSGGVVLPDRHVIRKFVGFATTPVSTTAQFNALANDAARDNAVILSDADAPIGSTYIGLTHASGAVTGCAMYRKSAATTWTAL